MGENRPRMKTTMTNGRCANGSGFDRLNPTASGWVGLSLRRIVGFGGRVRGGKPSTNEKPRTPALTPGASVNE